MSISIVSIPENLYQEIHIVCRALSHLPGLIFFRCCRICFCVGGVASVPRIFRADIFGLNL